MIVISAPNEDYSIKNHYNFKIFLSGGILNCPDWQSDVINRINDEYRYSNKTIYNPRCENFPFNDDNAPERFAVWQYEHLKMANAILFWFPKESLGEITLYELGKWGNSSDKIISIGCDPEYKRINDVILQTKLARRNAIISTSLENTIKNLASQISGC